MTRNASDITELVKISKAMALDYSSFISKINRPDGQEMLEMIRPIKCKNFTMYVIESDTSYAFYDTCGTFYRIQKRPGIIENLEKKLGIKINMSSGIGVINIPCEAQAFMLASPKILALEACSNKILYIGKNRPVYALYSNSWLSSNSNRQVGNFLRTFIVELATWDRDGKKSRFSTQCICGQFLLFTSDSLRDKKAVGALAATQFCTSVDMSKFSSMLPFMKYMNKVEENSLGYMEIRDDINDNGFIVKDRSGSNMTWINVGPNAFNSKFNKIRGEKND